MQSKPKTFILHWIEISCSTAHIQLISDLTCKPNYFVNIILFLELTSITEWYRIKILKNPSLIEQQYCLVEQSNLFINVETLKALLPNTFSCCPWPVTQEWWKCNFPLNYWYTVMETGEENKENHQLENIFSMHQ